MKNEDNSETTTSIIASDLRLWPLIIDRMKLLSKLHEQKPNYLKARKPFIMPAKILKQSQGGSLPPIQDKATSVSYRAVIIPLRD